MGAKSKQHTKKAEHLSEIASRGKRSLTQIESKGTNRVASSEARKKIKTQYFYGPKGGLKFKSIYNFKILSQSIETATSVLSAIGGEVVDDSDILEDDNYEDIQDIENVEYDASTNANDGEESIGEVESKLLENAVIKSQQISSITSLMDAILEDNEKPLVGMNVRKDLDKLSKSRKSAVLQNARRIIFRVCQILYPKNPQQLLSEIKDNRVSKGNKNGMQQKLLKEIDILKEKLLKKRADAEAKQRCLTKTLKESLKTNEKYMSSLESKIDQLMIAAKMGSTMLVDSRVFLTLALTSTCQYCFQSFSSQENLQSSISTSSGFEVSVTCYCSCRKEPIIKNYVGKDGALVTKMFPASVLLAGIGYSTAVDLLQCLGVSRVMPESSFYKKWKDSKLDEVLSMAAKVSREEALLMCIQHSKSLGLDVLPSVFDHAWRFRRNSPYGIGTLCYGFKLPMPDGLEKHPIIEQTHSYRSREVTQKNGDKLVVREGNFFESSNRMEHFTLVTSLNNKGLVEHLESSQLTLILCVDGDLDTLKTTKDIKHVSKLVLDLAHREKNIKKAFFDSKPFNHLTSAVISIWLRNMYMVADYYNNEYKMPRNKPKLPLLLERDISEASIHIQNTIVLFQHLCNDHTNCWANCFHKGNDSLEFDKTIDISTRSEDFRGKFGTFLDKIMSLRPGQSQSTNIRSFYGMKKKVGSHYASSYLQVVNPLQ